MIFTNDVIQTQAEYQSATVDTKVRSFDTSIIWKKNRPNYWYAPWTGYTATDQEMAGTKRLVLLIGEEIVP